MAKKFNEVVDSLRKNITREYKAKLTKDQRKPSVPTVGLPPRSRDLSAEEKQALEALFEKIQRLRATASKSGFFIDRKVQTQ